MSETKPFTIAIDGPDGVGKTTQLDLLRKYLAEKGLQIHTTRASGGTPIGEALRGVSLSPNNRPAETDLYISFAMYEALSEELSRRWEHIILIDRSPLAITAYNAYGSQLPDKQRALDATSRYLENWRIDLLLYLDAPQNLLSSRRQKRATQEYFENQNTDFHQRVRKGYETAIKHISSQINTGTQVVRIDATPDITQIHNSIKQLVDEQL